MHEAAAVTAALKAAMAEHPHPGHHLELLILDPTRAEPAGVAFYAGIVSAELGLDAVELTVRPGQVECGLCGASTTATPADPTCRACGGPLPPTAGPALTCLPPDPDPCA